ncbi:MAG: DUF6265 family protein [Fimbriimonadaceae bacterium]
MLGFFLIATMPLEPTFQPGNLPPMEPTASFELEDVAWMTGGWSGTMGEHQVEEHWSEPAGRQMMGMFRWLNGDSIQFYEFMTLAQTDTGVELRIKHFNDDLSGWEEKDAYVSFTLTSVAPNQAAFLQQNTDPVKWLVYERNGEDMIAYFLTEDQEAPGEGFRFRRITAGS